MATRHYKQLQVLVSMHTLSNEVSCGERGTADTRSLEMFDRT